jgi:hypothetical protein
MAWKYTIQFTALSGTLLGGWFAGSLTERWKVTQNASKCMWSYQSNEDRLLHEIKRMPGLPIFGTVSAASPANKPSIMEVPLESSPVPSKSTRVSEVQYILQV